MRAARPPRPFVRRVRLLVSGDWLMLTGAMTATLLSALATVGWPVIVGWGIDAAVTHHDSTLRHLELLLIGVVAAKPIVEWLRVAWTNGLGEAALGRLRTAAFGRVQSLPLGSLEQRSTGTLVSRMTADLEVLTDVVGQGFSDAVFGVVVLIVALVTLVRISPLLSLASLAGIPLLTLSIRRYLRVARPRSLEVREAVDDTLGAIQEYMTAQRIIRMAGREEDYLELYRARSRQVVAKTKPLGFASARFTAAFPVAYGLGLMVMLAAGAALMVGGHVQGGTVSACALAFVAVWNTVSIVLGQLPIFQSAGVAFTRVMRLVELDESLAQPPASPPNLPYRGAIALYGVTFSYLPGVAVLHDINLEIPAGQHVALVGATGAGKSALAGLIARSYDPQEGTVTFSGIPLPDIRVRDLRTRIVLVSQDARLLSGTIADNIALMEPRTDLAGVAQALEDIGAGGCFDRLPAGVETTVGEASLSAGERQLVALGRIALLDPAVVMLDEATAQLEPEMEWNITSALRVLGEGRTMITIAHHLDTTRRAHRVVVLDAGRVVDDGSPDELLRRGGPYAALWAAWSATIPVQ
jgi:ATP-binding cassette subfamily B protein